MPERTKDDDDAGSIGLSVVFARLKEVTATRITIAPATVKLRANNLRDGNTKVSAGTAQETSHMSAASNTPIARGGTFNSRYACDG